MAIGSIAVPNINEWMSLTKVTSNHIQGVAASYWRSLRYFSIYRVVVALVFLITYLLTRGGANLASQNPPLYLTANSAYVLVAFILLVLMQRVQRFFSLQLTIQVATDVGFLTLLMYASGGQASGIPFMLVVVVAAAAMVGHGRLTLFFASIATIGILVEQVVRKLTSGAGSDDFVRTGLISIGFFATAVIARALAQKVVANEELARARGIELANQVKINLQVVQDMEDGVLVVDEQGIVRLHNRQAEALLAISPSVGERLSDYSSALAEHVKFLPKGESLTQLKLGNGRTLLVRWVPPEDGSNTLIYLQDLARIQDRAQQLKLAALGRLTANIAHEIRNPLAAISNAGELLIDEQRADGRARLVRIIGDNSRRLNRLVGEVLELGKRDRVHREEIGLAGFLGQFLEELSLQDSTASSRVFLDMPADETVCFDRAHLYRIVDNLVANALRFATGMPASVHVMVARGRSGWVEVNVIDDGPGIPSADRSKIFEPFFTTRGNGTGLGLYIARELSEANSAHLELVDSQAGAHFRLLAKGGACPPILNDEIADR